jgi:aryl-alcohol dehydrogenase-like predicted oxidoreductase
MEDRIARPLPPVFGGSYKLQPQLAPLLRLKLAAISQACARARLIKAVAEGLERTPGAVALTWTLRNSALDRAIVGFRCPDQADTILGAANLELGQEDGATIEGRV